MSNIKLTPSEDYPMRIAAQEYTYEDSPRRVRTWHAPISEYIPENTVRYIRADLVKTIVDIEGFEL